MLRPVWIYNVFSLVGVIVHVSNTTYKQMIVHTTLYSSSVMAMEAATLAAIASLASLSASLFLFLSSSGLMV